MKNFRKLNTADLEQFKELEVGAYNSAVEERSFFRSKAYRFPAYIKQVESSEQEVKDIYELISAIDKELDNR